MTKNTGRYWLVWEDGTPEAPESPYAEHQLFQAYDRMRQILRRDPSAHVEIRQCIEEQLVWAGINPDAESINGDEDAS